MEPVQGQVINGWDTDAGFTSAGTVVFRSKLVGDANDRVQILADGTVKQGLGVLAPTSIIAGGTVSVTGMENVGETGAVAASNYAGGTVSGAPVTGTFDVGDFIVDQSGGMWVCTVLGSPGTWVQVGAVSAGAYSPAGLTGAISASRYVGATTTGPPLSGTFAVGDYIVDRLGNFWVCTAAGTPGSWGMVGQGNISGDLAQQVYRSSLSRSHETATGFTCISGTVYGVYLGFTTKTVTLAKLRLQSYTGGTGAQTAEWALATSPLAPNGAGQTLTRFGPGVSFGTALTGTGVIAGASIAQLTGSGAHLWAIFREAMATTQNVVTGLFGDMGSGQVLSLAAGGVITATASYAMTVPADTGGAVGPDLQVATF